MYVIAGEDSNGLLNDVWKSDDGLQWERVVRNAPFEVRTNMSAISFKGEIILAAGQGAGLLNDVWKSDDGLNWILLKESASFPDREDHVMVIYNDSL